MKNLFLRIWKGFALPMWALLWRLTHGSPQNVRWSDPSKDPIRHIFVLMLENRSFDQVLGCLQDDAKHSTLDGIKQGSPFCNKDLKGNSYYSEACDDDRAPLDPKHEYEAVEEQIANGHAGFVSNFDNSYPGARPTDLQCVMNYFPKRSLAAIHWLAEHFTVCNRWFSSVPGPTWANRLFLLSGTSMGRVEMGASNNLNGFVGYSQTTIFNLLEDAGIPWRVYFHDFPQSLLLERLRHPRMARRYCPIGDEGERDCLETHLADEGEDFPRFCFIEPQYFEPGQNDDHPTSSAASAQQLIARVYNAIRSNEAIWDSSLLIVTYDEHGGFYDHVEAPDAVAPAVPSNYSHADRESKCSFSKLGVRVPAILVSRWVDASVCSEQFDHTSILKYACMKWHLTPPTARVEGANGFEKIFLANPRNIPVTPLSVPPVAPLYGQRAWAAAPEQSDHQQALRELSLFIEASERGSSQRYGRVVRRSTFHANASDSNEMKSRSLDILEAIRSKPSSDI